MKIIKVTFKKTKKVILIALDLIKYHKNFREESYPCA